MYDLRMSKRTVPAASKANSRVIGSRAFAAITAVEGLRLSATSKKRLATLRESGLTPAERRAEVVRAYAKPSKVK